MPLLKPLKDCKTAILLPAYKRPEYTKRCIQSVIEAQSYPNTVFYLVDDGSGDSTGTILESANLNKHIVKYYANTGLRNVIIDFFAWAINSGIDIIAKLDNDCYVPHDWLNKLLDVLDKSDADILSPNVFPSNAAMKLGKDDVFGKGYREATTVGGLWVMKRQMIDGIRFEKHDILGIKGAFNLLYQIKIEKDPIMGWVPDVLVQDVGHWSGLHAEHIKTKEHVEYSREVGRGVSW